MTSEQNASLNKVCIEQEKTKSELEKMTSQLLDNLNKMAELNASVHKICIEQEKTRSELEKMKSEQKEQTALIVSLDKKMYIYCYSTFILLILAIFLLLTIAM